jgi:hypothetical protein
VTAEWDKAFILLLIELSRLTGNRPKGGFETNGMAGIKAMDPSTSKLAHANGQ